MRFRLLCAALAALLSTHALAYDPSKAVRYPSDDMYRPNVNAVVTRGMGSNAALRSMVIGDVGAAPASVTRYGFAAPGDSPPTTYVASNAPCALNGGQGDGGSQVPSADGKCWLAVFPGGVVDVTVFGADRTGAADAVPPVNAALALGSGHKFVFPPGRYRIGSLSTTPYSLMTGRAGFHLWCSADAWCHDIEIAGEGATIFADAAVSNSDWFGFSYWRNFSIHGLTMEGNPAGWPSPSEPTAFIVFNMTNFRWSDMTYSGNWGGSTRNPVALAADNLTDGVIDNWNMPAIAECFDVAFLRRVTFTNIKARGADDNNTGARSNSACFHIEYDRNTVATYPWLVPFLDTSGVTIGAGVDVSNFTYGGLIMAGSGYSFGGSYWHDNPNGYGLKFQYNTEPCCYSNGDPPRNVNLSGAIFRKNGTGTGGAGVMIDAVGAANGELVGPFAVDGSIFDDNYATAIVATPGSAAHMAPVSIGLGNAFTGATQYTRFGGDLPATFPQVLASYSGAPSPPAGTASASSCVMMGLGGYLVPRRTGKLSLSLSGTVQTTVAGGGYSVQLRYGTGSAPANGAAAAGTQVGAAQSGYLPAAYTAAGFSVSGMQTGVPIEAGYWVDACVSAIGSGTASISGLSLNASEQF